LQASVGRKPIVFWISKIVGTILLAPFFRLQTNGTENLPHECAFVLLPKHQRWEDIPLLGLATPRPLYYVAKYELFNNPLSNWFVKSLGGIPLNRQRPFESRRFLQITIGLLEKGEGVVIFPEGTYYINKMGPGQVGVVRFVLNRLSLPFIPVGIHYARKQRHTLVHINFGQAFYADPAMSAAAFVERMMQKIAELSGLQGG
jgi:1-acyl-sn-glycerol-3-phosphate acyltransferase